MDSEKRPRPTGDGCPLAHDLNNSLTVILAHCEILAARLTDSDAAKRLRLIYQAASHMAGEIANHPCRVESTPPRHSVGRVDAEGCPNE